MQWYYTKSILLQRALDKVISMNTYVISVKGAVFRDTHVKRYSNI